MNPNTNRSDESIGQVDEVDENLVQENPSLHIQMNENEPDLKPHCIHGWTQLTKLIGINIIDANSSQPINLPEDHQAFLTIVTALSQPKSNLNHLHNWFHSETPLMSHP